MRHLAGTWHGADCTEATDRRQFTGYQVVTVVSRRAVEVGAAGGVEGVFS